MDFTTGNQNVLRKIYLIVQPWLWLSFILFPLTILLYHLMGLLTANKKLKQVGLFPACIEILIKVPVFFLGIYFENYLLMWYSYVIASFFIVVFYFWQLESRLRTH